MQLEDTNVSSFLSMWWTAVVIILYEKGQKWINSLCRGTEYIAVILVHFPTGVLLLLDAGFLLSDECSAD